MRIFIYLLVLMSAVIARADQLTLVDANSTADIYVDQHDAAVVGVAGNLLADDIERVTTHHPVVKNDPAKLGATAIVIGTIGQSAVIDQLIATKKIDVADVKAAPQQLDFRLRLVVPVTPLPRPRIAGRGLPRYDHDATPLAWCRRLDAVAFVMVPLKRRN